MLELKKALKSPIIYVTRDIERALGLPLETPGYFIISNFTPFAKSVARGRKNVVLVKEEKMLDTYELLKYIPSTLQGEGRRGEVGVVVFKPTIQIEKICAENGWKLLNPSAELSNRVEEKISQITWLGPLKKYLPDYKVQLCKNIKWPGHKFVLQFNRSHTGSGTILIDDVPAFATPFAEASTVKKATAGEEKLKEIKQKFPNREARVAKYIEGPLFTNNNVVTKDTVLLGNINYQITGLLPFTDNPFTTIGNDWELPNKILTKTQTKQYKKIATDVGNRLRESGWKGLFGIDVVLEQKTGKLYLLEINCRQPASTTYESQLQQSSILNLKSSITIFQAHLLALLDQPLKAHKLISLKSGAQIIQRVTKDIPALPEPRFYKPDNRFTYIHYNNTKPCGDRLRLQTKQGIMESHNKLNALGNQLMDFVFCTNGGSRWNAPRGAVIIIKDKKILLIKRHKCGRDYYILPGGTMDKGETIKQTAIREAKEETGFDVTLSKQKPWKSKFEYRDEYYFFVDKTHGKCHLGGPEAKLNNVANHYGLEWVELKKLKKINLVPEDIKENIIKFSLPCSQGRARERSGQTYL